ALKKMRLERSQRKNIDGVARIEINKAVRSGELVVRAINAGFAYGKDEQPIISSLNTSVMRGDRVGIIGPNGMGKTTLLKLLLGEIHPTTGSVKLGTNVECAYFDQLGGQLELEKSLADNIGHGYDTIVINGRRKQIVSYLMDFMFTPSKSTSPVSNLSGGERNRLQIARIFTQPSNLLVLDEPTNDLDVETLELLEEMLIQYTGTVLIVSHDREFINNVVTSTLVLEGNGVVKEYAGGYDDWIVQRKKTQNAEKEAAAKDKPQAVKRPKPAKRTYQQNQEMQKLPGIVEKLEKQVAELHEQMLEPSFYKQDGAIIAKAGSDLEKFSSELAAAYKRWEELMDVE
ncbi:MAG: ATP-binding cassette domain-containing protein, partial [Phycisphaerae bacterium]